MRMIVTLVPSAKFRGALTARVVTLRTVRAVGTLGVTRLIGSKGEMPFTAAARAVDFLYTPLVAFDSESKGNKAFVARHGLC